MVQKGIRLSWDRESLALYILNLGLMQINLGHHNTAVKSIILHVDIDRYPFCPTQDVHFPHLETNSSLLPH